MGLWQVETAKNKEEEQKKKESKQEKGHAGGKEVKADRWRLLPVA